MLTGSRGLRCEENRDGLNASTQCCVEGSGWCVKAEGFSQAGVELAGDVVELGLRELREVGSFG
jgi:hypothetical protein